MNLQVGDRVMSVANFPQDRRYGKVLAVLDERPASQNGNVIIEMEPNSSRLNRGNIWWRDNKGYGISIDTGERGTNFARVVKVPDEGYMVATPTATWGKKPTLEEAKGMLEEINSDDRPRYKIYKYEEVIED